MVFSNNGTIFLYGQCTLVMVITSSIYLFTPKQEKMLYISILYTLLILNLLFSNIIIYSNFLLDYCRIILVPLFLAAISFVSLSERQLPLISKFYILISIPINTLFLNTNNSNFLIEYSFNILLASIYLLILTSKFSYKFLYIIMSFFSFLNIYTQNINYVVFGFIITGVFWIIAWIKEYNQFHKRELILLKKLEEKLDEESRLKEEIDNSLKRQDSVWAAYLQAQIKPHFLFNVLNSIAILCKKDPDKAYSMTLLLAKYLHSSYDFKNTEELIPIEKEIELTISYAKIQKLRFPKISMIFDIQIDYQDIYVPPFTIQPLVENAIRHGLKSIGNQGEVIVKVHLLTSSVIVSVANTGVFDTDAMYDRTQNISSGGGIGLYNINSRLMALLGSRLSFQCTNNYSVVLYEIPFRKEK